MLALSNWLIAIALGMLVLLKLAELLAPGKAWRVEMENRRLRRRHRAR